MNIYLWVTGSFAGLALLVAVYSYLHVQYGNVSVGSELDLLLAILGWIAMIATGFFAIIHGIGWLVRWLM